jgi:hypothetical protein
MPFKLSIRPIWAPRRHSPTAYGAGLRVSEVVALKPAKLRLSGGSRPFRGTGFKPQASSRFLCGRGDGRTGDIRPGKHTIQIENRTGERGRFWFLQYPYGFQPHLVEYEPYRVEYGETVEKIMSTKAS